MVRRKFVVERVMPLLHSPVAEGAARWQAVRLVCRAAAVPSAALHLTACAGTYYTPAPSAFASLPDRFCGHVGRTMR